MANETAVYVLLLLVWMGVTYYAVFLPLLGWHLESVEGSATSHIYSVRKGGVGPYAILPASWMLYHYWAWPKIKERWLARRR